MFKFDRRRNAAPQPVGNALRSTRIIKSKQPSKLRRAAMLGDYLPVSLDALRFIVHASLNTMFKSKANILCINRMFNCETIRG